MCALVFAVQPVQLILNVTVPTPGLRNDLEIQTYKHIGLLILSILITHFWKRRTEGSISVRTDEVCCINKQPTTSMAYRSRE